MTQEYMDETLYAADMGIPGWYITQAMELAGDDENELYGLLCSYEGELEP